MDLTVIFAAVSGLVIIILLYLVLRWRSKDPTHHVEPQAGRIPAARNARARLRAAAAVRQDVDGDNDAENVDQEKIGAKKRAKLEAKAEKKAQREVEERQREESKKKKELLDAERKKQEEKELSDEKKQEEEERKAKEEKERQEHEEYLKLKASFKIEETGFDDTDITDNDNLLQEFITYIKETKVILMEDVAAKFNMKTQSVIDRITDLQREGRLTGVIDDRGKFIYISQSELEAVAKFVKQRGRVSVTELVENSQRLINVAPKAG